MRAVRNFIFNSHSSPVMAWKNQPSDFFAARISTTDREFQSVSLNNSDWFWMRSITSARMRPSQRQGLPLRPTRATVCQWRPSISQGMRASWPTSVMSRSPSRSASAAAKSNSLRGSCGPAARTGASASPV